MGAHAQIQSWLNKTRTYTENSACDHHRRVATIIVCGVINPADKPLAADTSQRARGRVSEDAPDNPLIAKKNDRLLLESLLGETPDKPPVIALCGFASHEVMQGWSLARLSSYDGRLQMHPGGNVFLMDSVAFTTVKDEKVVEFDPNQSMIYAFQSAFSKELPALILVKSEYYVDKAVNEVMHAAFAAASANEWELEHAVAWTLMENDARRGDLTPQLRGFNLPSGLVWRLEGPILRDASDQPLAKWSLWSPPTDKDRRAKQICSVVTDNEGTVARATDLHVLKMLKSHSQNAKPPRVSVPKLPTQWDYVDRPPPPQVEPEQAQAPESTERADATQGAGGGRVVNFPSAGQAS